MISFPEDVLDPETTVHAIPFSNFKESSMFPILQTHVIPSNLQLKPLLEIIGEYLGIHFDVDLIEVTGLCSSHYLKSSNKFYTDWDELVGSPNDQLFGWFSNFLTDNESVWDRYGLKWGIMKGRDLFDDDEKVRDYLKNLYISNVLNRQIMSSDVSRIIINYHDSNSRIKTGITIREEGKEYFTPLDILNVLSRLCDENSNIEYSFAESKTNYKYSDGILTIELYP